MARVKEFREQVASKRANVADTVPKSVPVGFGKFAGPIHVSQEQTSSF